MEDWHSNNACLTFNPVTPASISGLVQQVEIIAVGELNAFGVAGGTAGVELDNIVIHSDGQHWVTIRLLVAPVGIREPLFWAMGPLRRRLQ